MAVRPSRAVERKARLDEELRRLCGLFPAMGVLKALVFGSAARDEVGSTSDLDLILIKNTAKKFLDRLHDFYAAACPRVAVDVLVYTPEEFDELAATSSLLRRAKREGRVVYEAEAC